MSTVLKLTGAVSVAIIRRENNAWSALTWEELVRARFGPL